MAAQSYSLTFQGYWRERNKWGVPNESGIYCVYRCKYDPVTTNVTLGEVIYIGESDKVRDRIAKHERQEEWGALLHAGEELCYSFAPIRTDSRVRAEAAMIFNHKPRVNDEYKYAFPFDQTTITTDGTNELLTRQFTVTRTP